MVNGFPFREHAREPWRRLLLVVNRAVREGAGATAGGTVTVEMERDDEPRTVDVPDELRDALAAEPEAREFFERLAYSHRKEYVDWILEAKRDETRRRRVERTLELLRDGAKTPNGAAPRA